MFVFATWVLFTAMIILWLRAMIKHDTYALSLAQVAVAFIFKVMLGCAYGYIFLVKYNGDDTWWLHEDSLGQYDLLKDDPWLFLTEMDPFDALSKYGDPISNIYYYIANLEVWLMTKPLAFVNFLSGGNYYINILFFNVPVFFGHYWLYGMIRKRVGASEWPAFAAAFLVPPVVFWLSGLRAEGLLFFFTMLAFRRFNKLIGPIAIRKSATLKNVFLFLIAMLGILILRSVFVVLLIPAFISWWLVEKRGRKPVVTFALVYGTCIAVCMASTFLSPHTNAATVIVERQMAFFQLEGNTRFQLDTLTPDPISFARILPQAVNNTFLRPFAWEAEGALQYAAVMEVFLFLALLLLFLYRKVKNWKIVLGDPFILSLLYFSLFLYLVTGYTVPFPGAIVRYKAIGEMFFFVVFTSCIDWRSLFATRLRQSKIS